jgi:hypothetical protein
VSAATENLAKAEAARGAFAERHFPTRDGALDHGTLNLPLRKRGNIDSEARQWRKLNERVDYWAAKVAAERRREQAPAIRQAKADAHESANLRERYGDCAEVLWSMSGRWLPVIRWNAKSVTVDMGSRETIPHDQVAGAR